MSVFEAKIRQVGTSLGVLLPKEVVEQNKLENGEVVQIAVIKKNLALLKKAFGSTKGAGPFKRDHDDRVF